MREIALLMESMLQAIENKKSYETGEGAILDPHSSEQVVYTVKKKGKPYLPPKMPQGQKLIDQERLAQEQKEIKRSKKEISFVKRGLMLKDAIKNRDYEPNIDAYGLNEVD